MFERHVVAQKIILLDLWWRSKRARKVNYGGGGQFYQTNGGTLIKKKENKNHGS